MLKTEFIVIGGGIIGLAVAYYLRARQVLVLEKEPELAAHQSGRNSGVLHSGIYYRPGSLKARTCRTGKALMEQFCTDHRIAFERCGKIIVAKDRSELERLHQLYQRGRATGAQCELIGVARMRELEPYVRGVEAIHVPETGIVDFRRVCAALARGANVRTGQRVTGIGGAGAGVSVVTGRETFVCDHLINCAGLHSDRVAAMSGTVPEVKIIPFLGKYYTLRRRHLCNALIYPVPDPRFPFLGVHFTKTISGEVECGPNAVLALGREAYDWRGVNWRDALDSLLYPGLWKLMLRHWRVGLHELSLSVSRRRYVNDLRGLVPAVAGTDLVPRAAGIRAQAVTGDGKLVDDFVIQRCGRITHVLNTPSPAATASLAIAKHIVEGL
jgi:(S)-2-hydroxyglutarate dehydrogenase